ncbi:MAG TPA: hypothetical protein VJ992_15180 [Gemmatimonadales bacterium]|nr:hypothetical protein [Gemmatimonadales bacterium]
MIPLSRGVRILGWAFVGLLVTGCVKRNVEAMRASDLEGARQVFAANIDAIHKHDAAAYLATYLHSPNLVAASPNGLVMGFGPLAKDREQGAWPDTLVAGVPTLVWISAGVVYGAYHYVAKQGDSISAGWSERLFVKTDSGWKIAVTSVIPSSATP